MILTDVQVLFRCEEMIDIDELLFDFSLLEGDFSECASVFPLIEEVDIMPLSDLIVMRHRFMNVGVSLTLESLIAISAECEHSSSQCSNESG